MEKPIITAGVSEFDSNIVRVIDRAAFEVVKLNKVRAYVSNVIITRDV